MPTTHETTETPVNEPQEVCDYRQTMKDYFDRAKIEPNYPISREDFDQLLLANDYVIPPGGLEYTARTFNCVWPSDEEGWDSVSILCFLGVIHQMRWFRRAPDSIHWAKLSAHQRDAELAKRNGTWEALANHFSQFTVHHLLYMLRDAPDTAQADKVLATIELRLEAEQIE